MKNIFNIKNVFFLLAALYMKVCHAAFSQQPFIFNDVPFTSIEWEADHVQAPDLQSGSEQDDFFSPIIPTEELFSGLCSFEHSEELPATASTVDEFAQRISDPPSIFQDFSFSTEDNASSSSSPSFSPSFASEDQCVDFALIGGMTAHRCQEPDCTYISKTKKGLNEHAQHYHPDTTTIIIDGGSCPSEGCRFFTNWPTSLKRHLKTHGKKAKYKCNQPDCTFKSIKSFDVIKHIEWYHQGVIHTNGFFTCTNELCNFTAKRASLLIKHLQIHIKPDTEVDRSKKRRHRNRSR